MRDVVQWTTAAPLWPQAAAGEATQARRAALLRPALLRFATDDFMDEFIALLEQDPARLAGLVAQAETWRDLVGAPAPPESVPKFALPLRRARLANERRKQAALAGGGASLINAGGGAGPTAEGQTAARPRPLKLYQPAHQRYYLLASSLVCGRAGLPDRALDPARDERATFVIRRLFPATVTDAKTGAQKPFVNAQTGEVDRSSLSLPAFDETWEEYAFVTTPEGDAGWRKVSGGGSESADSLVAGEEQLPLFSLNYTQDDGLRRRVFAGLVPVGRREGYMGASFLPPPNAANAGGAAAGGAGSAGGDSAGEPKPFDQRMMTLWLDVTEPWKRLVERADAVRRMQRPDKWPPPMPTPSEGDEPMKDEGLSASLRSAREQIQTGSWYVLLDFAAYLRTHFRTTVWAAVETGSTANLPVGTPQRALYDALASTRLAGWRKAELVTPLKTVGPTGAPGAPVASPYVPADVRDTLADALRSVAADPNNALLLESASSTYDRYPAATDPKKTGRDAAWPAFLFPLAHPEYGPESSPDTPPDGDTELGPLPAVTVDAAGKTKLEESILKIDAFAALVEAALPPPPPPPPVRAPVPLAAQKVMDTREGFFRLRCVYERPLCGPIDKPLVSAPTREFQLAAFFDPDAPARPIRIGLPIDTSPAGLRKFDKNTAFMMSDILCGQVQRMKGMSLGDLVRSVLPWPLHKDLSVPDGGACKDGGGLQVGMICSLSIPIVTICALLLLMIIVSLLDFIFRWIPFFLICFPLPGFAAKRPGG